MNLISISALQDNYIWILNDQHRRCLIVDPGESAPILSALRKAGLTPTAALLTHNHHDHVDGVDEICNHFPELRVYGPHETDNKFSQISVKNGDKLVIGGLEWQVFATPGHTPGHISYYSTPYLFCGDTMFSAGCGRLLGGTSKQMYQSLQRLATLPDETLVCAAHEYTLSNLEFARSILPEDHDIHSYERKVRKMHEKKQSSLPSTLGLERKINLFLRCGDIDLKKN